MTIALVTGAHASAGGLNGATTAAVDTTGANLIVIASCFEASLSPPVISDSKLNSWTPLTEDNGAGSNSIQLWYCAGATVGAGHTFTITRSGAAPAIAVAAFSGTSAAPFDVEVYGSDVNSSTTSIFNTITPTEDNELVVFGLTLAAVNTPTCDNAGFTFIEHLPFLGGSNYGIDIGYLVQTTAGGVGGTWSWSTGCRVGLALASFKAGVASVIPSYIDPLMFGAGL